MTLRATSGAFGPANITSGNITGVTGAPYTLAKGGIALIGLATSTVTAGGVITVGTALPLGISNAFCWLPANANATVSAAGWYFCTFSTTTAGVMFQNTYTSGIPTIPASPTACTTASNFTGDLTEEFGNTYTVPAGAMGATGLLRVSQRFAQTSNATAKTARVRMSGNAGTTFFSYSLVSTPVGGYIGQISNLGITNQNVSECMGTQGGGTVTADVVGAVDTASAMTLVFSLQRAGATDNVIMLPPTVEVLS